MEIFTLRNQTERDIGPIESILMYANTELKRLPNSSSYIWQQSGFLRELNNPDSLLFEVNDNQPVVMCVIDAEIPRMEGYRAAVLLDKGNHNKYVGTALVRQELSRTGSPISNSDGTPRFTVIAALIGGKGKEKVPISFYRSNGFDTIDFAGEIAELHGNISRLQNHCEPAHDGF